MTDPVKVSSESIAAASPSATTGTGATGARTVASVSSSMGK